MKQKLDPDLIKEPILLSKELVYPFNDNLIPLFACECYSKARRRQKGEYGKVQVWYHNRKP